MTQKKTSKKQKLAKQPVAAKAPRTLTLVLAIIASVLVTVVLYVLCFVFMDYLDTASPDAVAVWLGIFVFVVVLAPGLLVAAIIYPLIKKK